MNLSVRQYDILTWFEDQPMCRHGDGTEHKPFGRLVRRGLVRLIEARGPFGCGVYEITEAGQSELRAFRRRFPDRRKTAKDVRNSATVSYP